MSWTRDNGATGGYLLQVRRKNGTWPATASAANSYTIDNPGSGDPSKEFKLDSILANGDGLADEPRGFEFQLMALDKNDATKNSGYSQFTVVDSPLRSVNGDSREGEDEDQMEFGW